MTAATRRTTRLRPIHFVLTLLLAFGGVFAVSAPAQATVPGQIDGYLTDTTLAPGNIYLDGLVVELYDTSGFVGYTTSAGGGYFSFTGLPDEDYDLYINGGPDNMDLEIAPFAFDDAVATDGELGPINLTNAVHLTGTVRDPAGDPIENVAVIVEGQPSGNTYFPDAATTSAGAYSVRVPGGEEYSLLAIDFGVAPSYHQRYWEQIYTHLAATCGCGSQPVTEVTAAPNDADHTGLDFELHPLSHVQFDMLADDLLGDPIGGLTIHLYKKVSGGYTPVEPGTTHTGAYDEGYVTSYGPGAGDYRLRFSYGSNYVPVDGWFDSYSSTGGPGGCYIDFNGLLDSDQFEMELVFDTSAVSTCGPEPAVVTPGGSGSSTPPKTRTFTSGVGSVATPTPTPTPSATPTSSPSPSSSPSSSPDPSETPTPTEPTSDAGFPWWIILIIVLVLGIIITIIVIVRRR